MRVEEAKTKVCPFIMGSGSINFDEPISNNDTTANINCICGDCMAWVYTSTHGEIDKSKMDEAEKRRDHAYKEAEKEYFDPVCNPHAELPRDVHVEIHKKFPNPEPEELPEDEKEGYCLRLNGME